MAEHYRVPIKDAQDRATVQHAFTGMNTLHELPPVYVRLLEAAAYLHDVGHSSLSGR